MAIYRRRRWRRPRRSRWRGGRRYLYWRRYGHHRRYRRWRRGHYRSRTASVRYYPSRRRKRISVRGWEPLGNLCTNDTASSEATPYDDLDKLASDPRTGDCEQTKGIWHGTWGHHFFTMENLLIRSKYYFNYWSSDWEGYDFMQFLGAHIWLPRMPFVDWIFGADSSIQSNPNETGPEAKYKNEKSWFHPGILLNRPGSKLMLSTAKAQKKPFYRHLYVKPPSNWEGVHRMDQGIRYLLFHWYWTVCNLTSPFFDFYCARTKPQGPEVCISTPWFICEKTMWEQARSFFNQNAELKKAEQTYNRIDAHKQDPRAVWVNRGTYLKSDCAAAPSISHIPANFHNWGPFLPQNVITDRTYQSSFYFRYKIYFKVSGDTVYRRLPSTPCKDAVIPGAPGYNDQNCGKVSTRSILKKRPLTTSDILPGDLDSDGILTERAYQRIIRSHRDYQSTRLGDEPHNREPPIKRVKFREPSGIRNRKRARELIQLLLGGRGESGGGGPPPGPPRRGEPLAPCLNFLK
uniref:Capsid protein n=1 Tax=Torque teno Leptonychotes weddellii virus-1 TaxID=2012676 RepID=A0A1Z2RVE3_9VIRU|nr:ORF1 [Torque teno Leptonychotes weddellii virus 1]